jgi:group I intron endonuclease
MDAKRSGEHIFEYEYADSLPVCKRTGVYAWICKITMKPYFGSSVDSIRQRVHYHRSHLRRGVHDNEHFQRAWDKYGEENFFFEVIEEVPVEFCRKREQYWIDLFDSANPEFGYNLAKFADASPMKGRKHSTETCKKQSERQRGIVPVAATAAAAIANRGTKRSEEFCENISNKLRGRKKSAEHMAKLSGENHWTKRPENAASLQQMRDSLRGRKLSEEQKASISAGLSKMYQEQRDKEVPRVSKIQFTD